MSKSLSHAPETRATKLLKQHRIAYSAHLYDYVPHGGTRHSAQSLNLAEHAIVKTLIMEDETGNPLIVLMHGDMKVSTKELARQIGCKRVEPCTPAVANRHSGYLVGGTSPFATQRKMRVFMEKTILDLPLVYINGGKRGFLIGLHPHDIAQLLQPVLIQAGLQSQS